MLFRVNSREVTTPKNKNVFLLYDIHLNGTAGHREDCKQEVGYIFFFPLQFSFTSLMLFQV